LLTQMNASPRHIRAPKHPEALVSTLEALSNVLFVTLVIFWL
jgi:hypothetical protein